MPLRERSGNLFEIMGGSFIIYLFLRLPVETVSVNCQKTLLLYLLMTNKIKCVSAGCSHGISFLLSLMTMQVLTCTEVIKCHEVSSNFAHVQQNHIFFHTS